jgi:polysaccharide pyruvyl transferase WcaK-like protein
MTVRLLVESGNYFSDNDNHGDRAMYKSIAARLRGIWPDSEIRWITRDADLLRTDCPDVTPLEITGNRQPGVGGGAGQRNAADAAQIDVAVRDCDLVLATGGGYFSDSFAGHAWTVLDTLEAGLRCGKPAIILSCGFEPVRDHALTEKMLAVLPDLNLVVCREPLQSPDVVRSFGVTAEQVLVASEEAVEFAFDKRPATLGEGLGINLRHSDYAGVGAGTIGRLREMLRGIVRPLGAPIVPIPTSMLGPSDTDAIRDVLGEFVDRMDDRRGMATPDDIVRRAGDCRLVIAGSYHAAVFALSQGVSVVALVASSHYRAKFRGLQRNFCGAGLRIVELERTDTMKLLAAAIEEGWRDAPSVRSELLQLARHQIAQSRVVYRRLRDMVESIDSVRERAAPIEIIDGPESSARPAVPLDLQGNSVTHGAAATEPGKRSAKPRHAKPKEMSSSPLHTLSADEMETFRDQGFLGPFTAFDPRDMERARGVIFERVLTTPTRYCPFGLRVRHLDSRTVYDLCSAPAIIGRMASLYGPDLVLWNSNLFNKPPAEPDRPEEYPWHQDHYSWNMEPVLNISAWLAIGPATEENGCVEVIPGSHRQIVPPVLDTNPHLSLRFGGVASNPTYVDETKKISLPLESGQFFLFNERLLHHSNPNRTRENRLGLAVRVTVPIVKVSEPFPCVLLSGEDRMGFNRYVDPPPSEPDAEWLASLPPGHRFEFDRPIPGMGWHLLENDGRNRFAWTGLEPVAWIDFRPVGPGDHVLRCEVVHMISQKAVDDVRLCVNGVAVAIEPTGSDDAVVLEARVPERVLQVRPDRIRVQFEGSELLRPCDLNPASSDKRMLGLGVRLISLAAAASR